jgi:hypothetical protein
MSPFVSDKVTGSQGDEVDMVPHLDVSKASIWVERENASARRTGISIAQLRLKELSDATGPEL